MLVVVIGAGVTGLAAADALGRRGIPVLLLDASDRVGGKARTEQVDGFVIDHGPDSFLTTKPAVVALARDLGLADAIVRPREPRTVFIRTRGRLRRLPDGMGLALPTRWRPFVTTDLLTPLDKARMALDLVLPRDRRTGDVGVGPFLARRLGRSLVDHLAGPLIGGVYGTPIDEVSLDAVVPSLRTAEREHRSLLLASLADGRARARATRAAQAGRAGEPKATSAGDGAAAEGSTPASPFATMAGGMAQLTDALAAAVRNRPGSLIRLSTPVVGLEAEGAHGLVRLAAGEALACDAVILATDGAAAVRLLAGVAPAAARAVESIPMSTTSVVTLAYPEAEVPTSVRGHGFLVADDEPGGLSGCTLTSRKWPDRAPNGMLLLRAFLRPSATATAGSTPSDDEALIDLARREIAAISGIQSRPVLRRITRHRGVMPQYTVGHLERVDRAEAALADLPWLRVAGASYRGAGLPDCVAQAQAAAIAVAALVDGRQAGVPPPARAAAASRP